MAHASGKLTSVEKNRTETGYEFVIKGENLNEPRVIRSPRLTNYIIEFDATLAGKKQHIPVNDLGIKEVTVAWYTARPPKIRLIFTIDKGLRPVVSKKDSSWIVTFAGLEPKDPMIDGTTTGQVVGIEPKPKKTLPAPTETIVTPTKSGQTGTESPGEKGEVPPAKKEITKTVVEKISATESIQRTKPRVESTRTAPPSTPKQQQSPMLPANQTLVTLDFVGTDIVQILKALSLQSGVNIVAAPEVSPVEKPVKLTVSLGRTGLEDAISYITAMAGLRYGRLGNTYFVTPSALFSERMGDLLKGTGSRYETKVISIVSGEAGQIRDAAIKSLPQDGRQGYYEIMVPGAGSVVDAPQMDKDGKPVQTAPKSAGKSVYYLMLMGDPVRLPEVERYIKDLDGRIAQTSATSRGQDWSTAVVAVQCGDTSKIKTMLDTLVSKSARASEISISESNIQDTGNSGSGGTKVLLMAGPKGDVELLQKFAIQLDASLCEAGNLPYAKDSNDRKVDTEVVELKYLDPQSASSELKKKFRNLDIALAPDSVHPGQVTPAQATNTPAAGSAPAGAAAGGSTGGAGAATAPGGQVQDATGSPLSIKPMRLYITGTHGQIEDAKKYLAKVDIPIQQIALELRVIELTKADSQRIGINWNLLQGGRLQTFTFNQGLGDTAASPGTVGGTYKYSGSDQVSAVATLDELTNGLNLIARPNTIVTDGQESKLFVGDTVRYIKSIQSTQNGTTVQTDEINVGVSFNVKARIGGDGRIHLAASENFSILTGFTAVPGGGSLPQTSDRSSTLNVELRSGETIAIGGLIQDQDRKRVSGIPLLKDIPILGKLLFSRTDNSRTQNEIVFFLTAVTITDGNRPTAASPRSFLDRSKDPIGDYKMTGPQPVKGKKKP